MTLIVNEIFGPTIQGEGPSSGRRAMFLRLARCNLDCGVGINARWECDTPYTWDWRGQLGPPQDPRKEAREMEIGTVLAMLGPHAPLIVVTGGEPMIQATNLAPLISSLLEAEVEVEIETNGTRDPDPLAHLDITYNVSPKMTSSGVERDRAINRKTLAAYRNLGARFKFVAVSPGDLDEISELVEQLNLDSAHVWIMPAGTDHDLLTRRAQGLAERVIAEGWNLTGRQHVSLWGNRRGV